MRALILGEAEKATAADVVEYAKTHVFDADDPTAPPPGRDTHLVRRFGLLDEINTIFSFTRSNGQLIRHISFSLLNKPRNALNPHLAEAIARLYGFTGPMDSWLFSIRSNETSGGVVVSHYMQPIPEIPA